MGWRKANSGSADVWDFTKNAELEGDFIRVENNIGPNNSNMYYWKTATGDVCCWGQAVLDRALGEVKPGDKVKITFKGMATSPKTGREYKDFEVNFWDED